MSLENIRHQIFSFLDSNLPEVMAIRGKWGVGKTFFWKQILAEAQKKRVLKINKYSYISLFGVNSLEAFKFLLFEQLIDKSLIGQEASIDTFKANADNFLKSLGRKSVHLFQGLPIVKNFGTAIDSIAFLSLKNMLICIDDFERKGDSLSAKDVLGLVSILKEQKFCKVVLIFNDEFFENKAKDDYKLFREKCIDIELTFNPSASECASIALPSTKNLSIQLKKHIEKLGINNIRIIKKIERIAYQFNSILSRSEEEVLYQALHSLCILSWCYYTSNDVSPDFQYVKDIGNKMYDVFDDEEQISEKEKEWNAILRKYDYQDTDELDLLIANAVETGFINESEFLPAAEKLNKQVIATKSENTLRAAWKTYHDSFEDNEKELIKSINDAVLKHSKYISPSGLNASVRLFRDLDQGELADKLISHYIDARKDEVEIFNLSNHPFGADISDPKIREDFKRIYESKISRPTLKEVLHRIAEKDGWGGEDERILSETSVDEFYSLFKSEKGPHLPLYIDKCLQFGRIGNASENMKKIAENTEKALERIGQESRLNARRVTKYGIKNKKE